jgi:hypothetical protein
MKRAKRVTSLAETVVAKIYRELIHGHFVIRGARLHGMDRLANVLVTTTRSFARCHNVKRRLV